VIDGVLRTHPANHLVLPGVTREVVIELAREAKTRMSEKAIGVAELPNATELFLTGTTTDVTPIVSVDGQTIGGGAPGPVARTLLDRLLERMDVRTPALASARN
jgi:D-alanine transaminase